MLTKHDSHSHAIHETTVLAGKHIARLETPINNVTDGGCAKQHYIHTYIELDICIERFLQQERLVRASTIPPADPTQLWFRL